MIKKKIKVAAAEAGITLAKLAKKMKVTPQMISLWTTGKLNPKIETLRKIAAATGKPLSYFLDDDSAAQTAAGNNNFQQVNLNNFTDAKIKNLEKEIKELNAKILKLEKENKKLSEENAYLKGKLEVFEKLKK
jgi:transcriptional regulator with XRE-family HTH domain